MREMLREPIKPRSEQGAANENHGDVNHQRPKASHDGHDKKHVAASQAQM
jgi:hypothetical protein